MRPANGLEIKAPTCQGNSLHLYEAVKSLQLPLSREIKGPPREGCPRARAEDGAPRWGLKEEDAGRNPEDNRLCEARARRCYLKGLLSDPGAPGAHSYTLGTAGGDIHAVPFFFFFK